MARRLLLPVLLALCAVLPCAGTARAEDGLSPAEVKRLKAEMALRAAIPGAVERGVAWLAKQRRPDGTFQPKPPKGSKVVMNSGRPFGKTALATLALAHCGLGLDDPQVQRSLTYLRKNYRRLMSRRRRVGEGATYGLCLFVMALHDLYSRHGSELPAADPSPRNPCGLPAWGLAVVRGVGDWLLETRTSDGLFSYPVNEPDARTRRKHKLKRLPVWATTSDMSNTQYGLLGLWAVTRCGYEVPKKDLRSISNALLSAQTSSGTAVKRSLDPSSGERRGAHTYAGLTDRARGFTYGRMGGPGPKYTTGSLTAGGLSSLLIAKAMLTEQEQLDARLERRLDHGIWDAIAWLSTHYDIEKNPGVIDLTSMTPQAAAAFKGGQAPNLGMTWYFYYLYGLERACVIAGKRFLGTHDWYLDGAKRLLAKQGKEGAWGVAYYIPQAAVPHVGKPKPSVIEASFALLFLQRATLRPRAPLLNTKR